MGLRLVWDFTGLWIEKNKHESVPESEGQRASVQSGSGLGCAQQRGLRLSAGPLSVLLQGPPTAGDAVSAQRLWATRLDQIQCVQGAQQQEAGGPQLSLLHPPRPPPDGLNGQDHASIKTHKTQVGVWEERARGCRENVQCRGGDGSGSGGSVLPPECSLPLAGREGCAAGRALPSYIRSLVYLDSLLMTLMRAPFSSFSLWLSDFSSVNTFISSSISDIFRSKARLSRFSISSMEDRSEVFSCFCWDKQKEDSRY